MPVAATKNPRTRRVWYSHIGRVRPASRSDQAVAEANQVLLFNHSEGYRVSHPVPGGDASLDVVVTYPVLRELTPRALLGKGETPVFRRQRLRIDPRAQALVALLRHSLRQGIAEPLEAESLALTLAKRALEVRTTHVPGASVGRQRLADRTKLVLASDPARRWTLARSRPKLGVPLCTSRRYSSRLKGSRCIAINSGCGWRERWSFSLDMPT